jgi:hypothetical protein
MESGTLTGSKEKLLFTIGYRFIAGSATMFWIPKTMRLIPRSPNEFTNTSKVEKR